MLVYYPTSRNWKKIKENSNKSELYDTDSRKEGYKSWCNPDYNIQMVLEWFRDMQLAAIQPNGKEVKNEDSIELKILRICITNCIENAKDVFYDWKRKELMFILEQIMDSESNYDVNLILTFLICKIKIYIIETGFNKFCCCLYFC